MLNLPLHIWMNWTSVPATQKQNVQMLLPVASVTGPSVTSKVRLIRVSDGMWFTWCLAICCLSVSSFGGSMHSVQTEWSGTLPLPWHPLTVLFRLKDGSQHSCKRFNRQPFHSCLKAAPWATFLSKPAEGKIAARSESLPVWACCSVEAPQGWHLGGCSSGERRLGAGGCGVMKIMDQCSRAGHQLGWWDSGAVQFLLLLSSGINTLCFPLGTVPHHILDHQFGSHTAELKPVALSREQE